MQTLLSSILFLRQIQDGALSSVRGGGQVQVRRQVSVCARHVRATEPAAASALQDRDVPHVPQRGLLPLWTALPLCAQCGRVASRQGKGGGRGPGNGAAADGAEPQTTATAQHGKPFGEPAKSALDVGRQNQQQRYTESALEHVDRIGPGQSHWLSVDESHQLDGQLLPVVFVIVVGRVTSIPERRSDVPFLHEVGGGAVAQPSAIAARSKPDGPQ